jgi:putative transposase
MDGKGLWRGNVYIGKSVEIGRYDEVYLQAYDSVAVARSGIVRYLVSFDATIAYRA